MVVDMKMINEVEVGSKTVSVKGRVISMSNISEFTSKSGYRGKRASCNIKDGNGDTIKVTFWTSHMKYFTKLSENDVVEMINLEAKIGYHGDLELQLKGNSKVKKVADDGSIEKVEIQITPIDKIVDEQCYNMIGRIIKLPTAHVIKQPNRTLRVVNITLMDATGTIDLVLWNGDTALVDQLELKQGDTVKLLNTRASYYNDHMQLNKSFETRIIKGDFDVPEYKQTVTAIGDLKDGLENVTVHGLLSKVYDINNFQRNDGSEGFIKTIEITDKTGKINATLWNKDASILMNKGDLISIDDARVEFDNYNEELRLSPSWTSSIVINPTFSEDESEALKSLLKYNITPISSINEMDEDVEVDVVGRVLSIGNVRNITSLDGTPSKFRVIDVADNTGALRVTLWNNKLNVDFKVGDVIKFENALTYISQSGLTLKLNRASRIIKASENEAKRIKSYEVLMNTRYKSCKVEDLTENMKDIKIDLRVMDVEPVRTYTKRTGGVGYLQIIYVADPTGLAKLMLWNETVNDFKLTPDQAITVINPDISKKDIIELQINPESTIENASLESGTKLPFRRALKNSVYLTKTIGELKDDEVTHVVVKGVIEDITSNSLLRPICPICHKTLQFDNGYVCAYCGDYVDEPEHTMSLSIILSDGDDTIKTVLFDDAAERMVGKSLGEVLDIIDKTCDESSLDDMVAERLLGHEVQFICDAYWSDYDNEIILRANVVDYIH